MHYLLLAIAFASLNLGTTRAANEQAAQLGSLGIAAYERGEYSAALYLLRSAVMAGAGHSGSIDGVDPWSAVYLSRMYLLGEGTLRDAPLACALFRAAVSATDVQTHDLNAASKFRRIIGQDPCGTASEPFDAEVMSLLNGCFLAGISKTQFDIENGSVLLDRTGIHIEVAGSRVDQSLPFFSNCQRETLSVALVSVPPFDAADRKTRTRYFISVFNRIIASTPNMDTRELQWDLIEIDSQGARPATSESLGRVSFEPCPALDCAAWLAQTVVAERRVDNRIYWRLILFNRSGVFN